MFRQKDTPILPSYLKESFGAVSIYTGLHPVLPRVTAFIRSDAGYFHSKPFDFEQNFSLNE